MSSRFFIEPARTLNLMVPGAGLILLNRVGSGLVLGLAFSITTAALICARFITPESYSGSTRVFLFLAAAACYIASQSLVARAFVARDHQRDAERRREALKAAALASTYGDHDRAAEILRRQLRAHPADLLLQVRLAEVLEKSGDLAGASEVWQAVQVLDKHRVYKTRIEAFQQTARAGANAAAAAQADRPPEAN